MKIHSSLLLLVLSLGPVATAEAQVARARFELVDVQLLPDITHPWTTTPSPMTGIFEWEYTPGDFENGSGHFLSATLPWYGSDVAALIQTIDLGSIELVLPGDFHGLGVDVQLKLTQNLSPTQSSAVDTALSPPFEISQGISNRGHIVSGQIVPVQVFTSLCAGDGTGAACPCGNTGLEGQGCANSSSEGATLLGAGSPSLAAADLGLDAFGLLPNQPALAFSGSVALSGGQGTAFGDGLRCAGGAVLRHGVRIPDAAGLASWTSGDLGLAGYSAGETRVFQVWYRDPVGGDCGTGFNLSSGLEVVFEL